MTELKINGKPGDEIALVYGDKTLVVKLGENEIVPDFVGAFDKAFDYYPYALLNAASSRYHNYRDGKERLLHVLAAMRDKLFDSIAPAPIPIPEPEPDAEEPEPDEEVVEEKNVVEEKVEPKKTGKKRR